MPDRSVRARLSMGDEIDLRVAGEAHLDNPEVLQDGNERHRYHREHESNAAAVNIGCFPGREEEKRRGESQVGKESEPPAVGTEERTASVNRPEAGKHP